MLEEVEVPGPAAVRRAARGPGRRRLATTAVVLALFGGAAVGYATLSGPDREPGPVDPTPTISVSPTPTGTAIPTSSPSVTSGGPTATKPAGTISRAQLLGAAVTLPAWRAGRGCPTSGIRLSGDDREGANWLLAFDQGDVDADGAQEAVVLVQCVLGSGGPMQVVAFDRDQQGKIVTLGRVVATSIDKPQWLFALDVVDDGTVRVQVGDIAPGGGWPGEWSQRQWRGYRFKSGSFAQSSGPTSFGPNPHDVNLVVTATNLVLADAPDGSRTGTITVRIRNGGNVPAAYVALRLGLPAAVRPDGDGWAACRDDPAKTGSPVTCNLNQLGAGKEVRLTLGFRVAAGATVGTGKADVDARPMDASFDFVQEVYDPDNTVVITYG